MHKRQLFMLCCLATLLIVCPAALFTRVSSNAPAKSPVLQSSAVQLQAVLSGLSNTVYVTNSQDGSNRLFIIEKAGRIRVAQPGSTTTTLFLDISSRVLSSGNEQGLLGLAFHPQYPLNGRFFVYYTRQTDGALTIAQYQVSADPNVANGSSELVILTIPHPTNTNHNGGTILFGPDGFLYAGPGDGGSANDPPNNAQNINALLGKILRIDVDHANGSIPYSSPPGNPFFGATAGADEIYAYGMRNPYRYSFDRQTGQLWVADVGQSAREEIDIVTPGGNYGWRVMEGSICNPAFNGGVCTPPPGSILPVFDYDHSAGRCSVTGGFVYRGARLAVPTGAYVYADYCTGEMWQLLSGANSLLMDTALNITSFGEDEAGEIYVVGQNGTVSRLTTSPAPPPCTYGLSATTQSFAAAGGQATLTLTTAGDCGWLAASTASWITLDVTRGVGSAAFNFTVGANSSSSGRSAIIRAGGQSLTITQSGTAPPTCTFQIAPTSKSFPNAGGTGTISVSTQAQCTWSATPSASWITITSGASGTGNGTVNYSVASNPAHRMRRGTITIANQVFNIKQK
jgi:glucose/arabinose dehydrogenase